MTEVSTIPFAGRAMRRDAHHTMVSPGELVDRSSSRVARSEDPARVAGDGWPSGGRDPANDLVGIHVRAVWSTELSAIKRATCAASLDDVRGRYG